MSELSFTFQERAVEHLHSLGPRAVWEFLREIGEEAECVSIIEGKLLSWRRLTPEMVHLAGGDRFPPHLSVLQGRAA